MAIMCRRFLCSRVDGAEPHLSPFEQKWLTNHNADVNMLVVHWTLCNCLLFWLLASVFVFVCGDLAVRSAVFVADLSESLSEASQIAFQSIIHFVHNLYPDHSVAYRAQQQQNRNQAAE